MRTIYKPAAIAARWWRDRLEQGDRDAFERALEQLIEEELAREDIVRLKVDYDPLGLLLDAVKAAGVECSGWLCSARGILPMKTSMRIDTRARIGCIIEVQEGRSAQGETIFEAEEPRSL